MPLVSFCISTYKRPEILTTQLQLLIQQTYSDFEIIISDNDPEESARNSVEILNDIRLKYFPNKVNIGMIKSFNKSIERAKSEYIVMITDDDPIDINFLREMIPLINDYPGKSLYCGFKRKHIGIHKIDSLNNHDFPCEVLHPGKNPTIFWSNCILRKKDVVRVGFIPDFGSPHLADHALLALTGSINGGVIKNKIYSSHHLHENNYSKGNFDTYYIGCIGFYKLLNEYFKNYPFYNEIKRIIRLHLKVWFISMSFSLRKYFYKLQDREKIQEIDNYSGKILLLDFMKSSVLKYKMKILVFEIKAFLGIL